MLVLSRQRNQSIIIGEDVVITVIDIRGDKVRLGIEAPMDIPVHRREVYEAIKRENERSSGLGGHIEPDKPQYINSQYLNSDFLCPIIDYVDERLNRRYNIQLF